MNFSTEILAKPSSAERLTGKLDGITQTLPDADFFLALYATKDATFSSQIEGTRATLMDALELDAGVQTKETDADDILFYIRALNYEMKRLKKFPLSLRFVRELHKEMMAGARTSQFADPGEFRRSQNWIGGTKPDNAAFVPPPVQEMSKALNDWEKFVHRENMMALIQVGLLHAQFETFTLSLMVTEEQGGCSLHCFYMKEPCWKNQFCFFLLILKNTSSFIIAG